eukprot:176763-Pleurochrysis_carterae.AAC.3
MSVPTRPICGVMNHAASAVSATAPFEVAFTTGSGRRAAYPARIAWPPVADARSSRSILAAGTVAADMASRPRAASRELARAFIGDGRLKVVSGARNSPSETPEAFCQTLFSARRGDDYGGPTISPDFGLTRLGTSPCIHVSDESGKRKIDGGACRDSRALSTPPTAARFSGRLRRADCQGGAGLGESGAESTRGPERTYSFSGLARPFCVLCCADHWQAEALLSSTSVHCVVPGLSGLLNVRLRLPRNEVCHSAISSCQSNGRREIHRQNASGLSFEELYRNAYNMVLHKFGDRLYNGLVDTITQHLREVAAEIQQASDEEFLLVLKDKWVKHKLSSIMIRDILMYMVR